MWRGWRWQHNFFGQFADGKLSPSVVHLFHGYHQFVGPIGTRLCPNCSEKRKKSKLEERKSIVNAINLTIN